jgi:hypothetical protein
MNIRKFAWYLGDTAVDPDYQEILDQAVVRSFTKPTVTLQALQNSLLSGLKNDGIFSELDLLLVQNQDSGSINFSLLNWVDPTLYESTVNGGVVHINNRGYFGGEQ